MKDHDRQTLRTAAERLLAVADGATLEWASDGREFSRVGAWSANAIGSEEVRIRQPAASPVNPPRPTPEQVAAARMLGGRKVKPPTVCDVPNGRHWFTDSGNFVAAHLEPEGLHGQRRWIAEPAEDVVTPWSLDPSHAGKVVVRKADGFWGTITHGDSEHFYISGFGWILPVNLLRDWTHNGQPCGDVAE